MSDRWLDLAYLNEPTADDLAHWAASAGFGHVGLIGSDDAVVLLKRITPRLIRLAEALAADRRPAAELSALDEIVSAMPGRFRMGLAGVAFQADAPPLVQVPLRCAIEAAEVALDPNRPRIGRCERADPPCGRLFVDRSRDGRGRWCSPAHGTGERVRRMRGSGASSSE